MTGQLNDDCRKDPRDDGRYINFTGPQLEQMKKMYAAGASLEKVGARYGISASVVSRRLKAMGAEVRVKGQPLTMTDEVMDRALELKASGMTWPQVSMALGYKAMTITAAIRARRARLSRVSQ